MITLAIVKSMLGISDTTYDTQINVFLPIVQSDVRRIINNRFDEKIDCTFASGATHISGLLTYLDPYKEYLHLDNRLEVGRVITHANIPEGTYITAYDHETGIATISETTTGAGSYIYTSVLIAQWQAIARMIWYRISKATTSYGVDANIESKSIGDVSVSFDVSKINKTYGYPQSIIDDLGTPYQRIG